MKRYLGIDLGGTNIAVGLVAEDGTLLHKDSVPTRSQNGYKTLIADMASLCEKIIVDSGTDRNNITAVGVGCPGLCDVENGVLVFANNLGLRHAPIRDDLQAALGIPVYIGNDANCAALGESIAGAAKGSDSSITVTLGTGVGGGIIIDQKIVTGAYGGGGEVGHIPICFDGEACSCGNIGCWEAYASATALIRQAKNAATANSSSRLAAASGNITGKAVFDAAAAGDETAQTVIQSYLRYVAIGLASLINTLQPETIVLGGGICAQGDAILAPITKMVEEMVLGGVLQSKIVIAILGNDAGIIGAAMLGIGVE